LQNGYFLPNNRAKRSADLAGSEEKLMGHAEQAVAQKDYQWALELCGRLLRTNPDSRQLKAGALRSLGSRQIAATARNYVHLLNNPVRHQCTA